MKFALCYLIVAIAASVSMSAQAICTEQGAKLSISHLETVMTLADFNVQRATTADQAKLFLNVLESAKAAKAQVLADCDRK